LELLAELARLSAASRFPLAMHVAECREELELLRTGGGPLFELLADLGAWAPGAIPPGARPLDYLERLAQAHRALVIHGNYLEAEELAFLGARADRMSVVFCPRTHAYFGHERYPLTEMLAAGVNVAVGTDSRASNPSLNLLEELRWVAARFPQVAPPVVLGMGTLAGARALGLAGELGRLAAGELANLAVVRLPEREAADPFSLLFDSAEPVQRTYRHGKLVHAAS
jgi:cytosine/adenosine deaminase-related metal-dependent hydrolase